MIVQCLFVILIKNSLKSQQAELLIVRLWSHRFRNRVSI